MLVHGNVSEHLNFNNESHAELSSDRKEKIFTIEMRNWPKSTTRDPPVSKGLHLYVNTTIDMNDTRFVGYKKTHSACS